MQDTSPPGSFIDRPYRILVVDDDPDILRLVSDKLDRAGRASLTRASGAGLGLYITRSLVELSGGRIWFKSELNQGSTFYVTFPIAAVGDDE